MIGLRTLGETHATDDTGRPLEGAATQRRILALLAVLAVAGEAGLSRDKLIGLLWAGTPEDRARHSLTQSLYAARRALRCDDLFVATTANVRLNFERIACDVCAFEDAVAKGELERAVAAYGGPFLDGFYVSGSAEFDQWASAQRERLRTMFAQALEQLAARAEDARNDGLVVEWRRRLAVVQPLDSANVVKLMRALANGGDRAGAIQQARLHAALLEQEMELGPDPVVETLAEQLRTSGAWRVDEPAETDRGTAEPVASFDEEETEPQDEPAPGASDEIAPLDGKPVVEIAAPAMAGSPHGIGAEASTVVWPARSVSRPLAVSTLPLWIRWSIVALVVVTLVGSGILIGRARRNASPTVERLSVPQRVVVAPFRVAGAAPSLAYLRDGMVELLSTRLADDSATRSVDAGAVLGAWRAAELVPTMDVPRDTVVKLADRLGAKRVVVGSVVGTPARVILRASVLAVPSGTVVAEATTAGPVEDLTTLIDRLAGQLLASEAGEDQQLAVQTTRSLPALRAFLAGQAALRALDYTAALRQYDVALRRDSTFALAALRSAVVADRLFDATLLRRALARAWAHREALGERDRMLLAAYVGERYPAPATRSELLATWQRILDAPTADADLWFALGSRIYHDGVAAGLPAHRARAIEALQRATASAPHPPAAGLLALMSRGPIDTSAATTATLGPFATFVRWHAAATRGDSAVLRHVRDTMYRLGPANLRAIAMSSQYDGVDLDDGAHAIELLGARPARTADRIDLLLAEHAHAVLRGRARDALSVTGRLERVQPGASTAKRLRVLDAVYGGGDSTAAAAAAAELATMVGPNPTAGLSSSDAWSSNVCVLGLWHLAREDSAAVRRSADALRARSAEPPTAVLGATPGPCAELLAAGYATLTRAQDASARVRRLDSLVLVPQVVGDLASYAPLVIARLHERLGDTTGALAAVRRRSYMSEWPRYLADMLRQEALLAARTGDIAGARSAEEWYRRYRPDAVGALTPQTSPARGSAPPPA